MFWQQQGILFFYSKLNFRMIASRSLSACPELRRVIREFYWDKALISTQPTSKGISELDWLHPFYNVKCIQDKPAISFESNDPDK